VLVAKVLQNAASGTLFKKEVAMVPLNDFLARASAQILEFYQNLISGVPDEPVKPVVTSVDVTADLSALHRYSLVVVL